MAAGLLDSILEDITGIGTGPDIGSDIASSLANFGGSFAQPPKVEEGNIFGDLPEMGGGEVDLGDAGQVPKAAPVAQAAQAQAPAGNWQQQAQQPVRNLQAIQQQNAQMLQDRPTSTVRYYTRQLYREMLRSRDPETRIQARLGLRFRGAPAEDPAGMVSNRTTMSSRGDEAGPNAANWRDLFPKSPEQPQPIRQQAQDTKGIIDNVMRLSDKILNRTV